MKADRLVSYIRELMCDGVLVAFSGGVDSALILKIASEIQKAEGLKVIAITFNTFLSPGLDIDITGALAKEYGVDLIEEHLSQIEDNRIRNNEVDRCFYCKEMLFKRAIEVAKSHNLKYVLDGTNKSDTCVYRPGLRALSKLGIVSPLLECGIDKGEVRELAQKYNISVAKRPSAPCLATRFPYNKPLPTDKFEMVDKGEQLLKNWGFLTNRIRLYDDVTRIEILPSDFETFILKKEEIISGLKELGFKYINLDMEGFRSGSMDEVLQ